MSLRHRFAALLLVLSLTARSTVAQTAGASATKADEDRIRQRRESSNAAIARHDTAGFAAILAEDLVVVTSNSRHDLNRSEHVRSMAAWFVSRPDVVYRRTPVTVRIFDPWRMASEDGTWVGSWTAAGEQVEVGGRFFAKWRFKDGDWFVESETYVPTYCRGAVYCSTVP